MEGNRSCRKDRNFCNDTEEINDEFQNLHILISVCNLDLLIL